VSQLPRLILSGPPRRRMGRDAWVTIGASPLGSAVIDGKGTRVNGPLVRLVGAALAAAAWFASSLHAQQPRRDSFLPPEFPAPFSVPQPSGKLATPRETLKTLYFSISAYDFKPALIDDAIACLECPPDRECSVAEAARLAIELDVVLRELCLPINAAPEHP